MNILVFNCGSSSQNAKCYRLEAGAGPVVVAEFKATGVESQANAAPKIAWRVFEKHGEETAASLTHRQAAESILGILRRAGVTIDAVGHRFVHGGEVFDRSALIDDGVMQSLRGSFGLAPIHNPNSYSVIEVCRDLLPEARQVAVFDTAFHARLPEAARRYAIPLDVAEKYGYRKFGFHGLSCQYVSARAARLLGKPLDQVKLILCHLGTGGSSVTAFAEGRSQDTSMGYSPLAGLVMSTRCGDLDPEIVIDLVRHGFSADDLEKTLGSRSGLIGLSGYSSNLAEVIERAEVGGEPCRLAFEVYAGRLRHYLGAFWWRLNGADAIVFTDGIGVSSWKLREAVCSNVENLGVKLDRAANRGAAPDAETWVEAAGSTVKILVLPTDEEHVILEETRLIVSNLE